MLTAKHGCGFLLWNTSTTLPSGERYSYHVPPELNVLQQFTDAMEAEGLGHGFYYSLTNNMYLNVYGLRRMSLCIPPLIFQSCDTETHSKSTSFCSPPLSVQSLQVWSLRPTWSTPTGAAERIPSAV